uniref:non-specific serine/threonine protein kinase n=1 Tax=Strongyloides stercoralis TaxID=6248 RepID=A0A0K0E2D3_STRER
MLSNVKTIILNKNDNVNIGTKKNNLNIDELSGCTIKNWIVNKLIGKGTYGVIYKCYKTNEDNKSVKVIAALKIVDINEKNSGLENEIFVLNELKKLSIGRSYFADLLDNGKTNKFKFFIINIFGKNLCDILVTMPNQIIEIRTWIRVIFNILEGLRYLHSIQFIHLDLKPANIIVDYKNRRIKNNIVVRLIDFGLAERLNYSNTDNKISLEPESTTPNVLTDKPTWIGSIYHCSPHIHRGCKPSYRDDIYSWLLVCIDLYSYLPWSQNDSPTDVIKKKCQTNYSSYEKCFPNELKSIIQIVMDIKNETMSPSNEILKVLENYMETKSITWNEPCQWENKSISKPSTKTPSTAKLIPTKFSTKKIIK